VEPCDGEAQPAIETTPQPMTNEETKRRYLTSLGREGISSHYVPGSHASILVPLAVAETDAP
jgi:hypothetical protein